MWYFFLQFFGKLQQNGLISAALIDLLGAQPKGIGGKGKEMLNQKL